MTPTSSHPPRSWLAALLSFLFPGLGQAYLGHWPLGAVLAAPIVLLVALGGVVAVAGTAAIRNQVLSSTFLIGLFVLNAALLAWRLFAIAHAGLAGPPGRSRPIRRPPLRSTWARRANTVLLSVLVVAAVGMHAYVANVVLRLQSTLERVFEEPVAEVPRDPAASSDELEPTFEWDGSARINFVFVGIDAAPGRQTALTDTILAVSVDPRTKRAAMVSIPRDTGYLPLADRSLYPNGLYPFKINQLASEAAANPAVWCPQMAIADEADATTCGIRTLEETISLYLGIQIHYFARIDFVGFEQLIDALGGVELCLPGRLIDPQYTDPASGAHFVLDLPAGCRRFSGTDALAYARSRKGWIEHADGTREPQNDFLRAGRQQEILLALRGEIASGDLLFELPPVLDAVGSTVTTDFPRSRAGDLASLVPLVTGPDIERIVLGYPEFVDAPADPGANYLLTPKRDAVRERMRELIGDANLEGWYLGAPGVGP